MKKQTSLVRRSGGPLPTVRQSGGPSKSETRLIVATSEIDADILYATRFFAPDPFIFLQKNGKRTLVLSDLEIDRARKTATADEFVQFSKLEKEVQNGARDRRIGGTTGNCRALV